MSENIEKVEQVEEVKAEAKTKKTAKKTTKKVKKDKKNPFAEMIAELKKVTWPSKEELRTYIICVIVFVLVSAVALFVMEFGVTKFIDFISNADKLPAYLIDWFNIGG